MNNPILIAFTGFLLVCLVVLTLILVKKYQQLRRSHRYQLHWKSLSENIPDLLIRMTRDLQIEYINPASANFLKGNPLSYLHQNLDVLINNENVTGFRTDLVQQSVNTGKSVLFEVSTKCKNNCDYFEIRIIPETDDQNQIDRLLLIGRDIGRQKDVEQELKHALKKAEESDTLKSAFLANMSHEIRTPLNAIVGFASIILEEDLTESEKSKYFRYIFQNSNQLITLINDIIDISKIESRQLVIRADEINLNQHLQEIEEIVNHEKDQREKTHLMVFLESDLPDEQSVILADPYRLRQVLINLLVNAIKFTPKGFIQFGYRIIEEKNILFYVRDSGIGIPKEHQTTVFQYFRQLDDNLMRKYGGTGLGLSISKNLVRLMGGKIWLESVEGKGTTFFFTIPFQPAGDSKKNS